jgi:hypothetical protein
MRFILGLLFGAGLGFVAGWAWGDLLRDQATAYESANDVMLEQARAREREAMARGIQNLARQAEAPSPPETPSSGETN